MPVTGIVGYPPSIGPDETVAQIRALWEAGLAPVQAAHRADPDESIARLRAAREAFPEAWLGIDNNFYSKTAADAIAFGRRLDGLSIGWFEDIVPPGDAAMVREIRKGISTPVAMGDEQGGSYHPQALLAFDAVDVCAWTPPPTAGSPGCAGSSRARRGPGNGVAPHMFPHVHSQVLGALGYTTSRSSGASRHRRSPDGRQPRPNRSSATA